MLISALNWLLFCGYCFLIYLLVQKTASVHISATEFFHGESREGNPPGLWLLISSAAISWIFAKSIDNAASLAAAFGITGGIGYAIYYLSFLVAAIAIYFLRVKGGYSSLSSFLVDKYGIVCAKLFLIAIAIRLFNEVWSNTKVFSLYFGAEGTAEYWFAAIAFTIFTLVYTLKGGLRSSLLTDSAQMLLAGLLLAIILTALFPHFILNGFPVVSQETERAGLTFCGLALVQIFSYPFHDPVLTDRAFITSPLKMLKGFTLAGIISGLFILLFSIVGLYSLNFSLSGKPTLAVPIVLGLPFLLVFNGIMLTSAGSTLDSTFSSVAKLTARDWHNQYGQPTSSQTFFGQKAMIATAILGNLPLLSIYLGDRVGPAIILATTISGTMVMGLAPIFLLSFMPTARELSFHLAFWPGLILGILRVLENALATNIFPAWIAIGEGQYAIDLGLNVYGLALCTLGYLIGAFLFRQRSLV
ncbi:Na+/proline symporter [Hyella patelloides LEGE 07179]|uniref:Na+/proline symporter n=1 Tax=Hyella patelloides LEGE 07179 TaxID=945734 RepID=A0A563VZS4_9CYAN|nr:Na+/proline symporter [Hyella patelloides]VEP16962.1 Na+/proline symporter [Hyella patelloides LEGE 07179]